jgi:hypothetical protein
LTSAHQNDLKTPKIINLKQRKKIKKKSNFFKSDFETQKQIGFRLHKKLNQKFSRLSH